MNLFKPFTAIFILLLMNCNKVQQKIKITDFSKTHEIHLEAKEKETYSSFIVKIKGETNDSVSVRMCDNCFDYKLSGRIDTTFSSDFYGGKGATSKFLIAPYKATSGNLLIEASIK